MGEARDGGYLLRRTVRGVTQVASLDHQLMASADARKLDERKSTLAEAYDRPAVLNRKGKDIPVLGPVSLFNAVKQAGADGVRLQRYKGLGEMNPEQLWETTLDRNVRTLLQVKIKEVDEADDIFVKLMGDVVEPRREFIQQNALSVANLDV
jgi:DNA gyrase subunit B